MAELINCICHSCSNGLAMCRRTERDTSNSK